MILVRTNTTKHIKNEGNLFIFWLYQVLGKYVDVVLLTPPTFFWLNNRRITTLQFIKYVVIVYYYYIIACNSV